MHPGLARSEQNAHMDRVVEAPVPHEARVTARLRPDALVSGEVPEFLRDFRTHLAQHPGAEHGAQPRHREVDRGVRVLLPSTPAPRAGG